MEKNKKEHWPECQAANQAVTSGYGSSHSQHCYNSVTTSGSIGTIHDFWQWKHERNHSNVWRTELNRTGCMMETLLECGLTQVSAEVWWTCWKICWETRKLHFLWLCPSNLTGAERISTTKKGTLDSKSIEDLKTGLLQMGPLESNRVWI